MKVETLFLRCEGCDAQDDDEIKNIWDGMQIKESRWKYREFVL